LVAAGRDSNSPTGLSLKNDGHGAGSETADATEKKLRQRIREKALRNTSKSRRFHKFTPILAGISVVLIVLFLQYNRLIFAPIMAYVSPGEAPTTSIEAIDPTITQTVSSEPRLLIPKLNIDVPIRFNVPLDGVMSAMNNGVAHYRIAGASAYPGEVGNFVITGHSAGDVYSSNPYKYIFSGLERLNNGDLIYVNYNSTRYTYRVTKKEVIEPTNVAALVTETNKPILTLVTCTPLGTSRYRLLVTAEQISPSSENAETAEQFTPTEETASLPANEPSFFESVWGFLTGQ
jgi:sortase A